MLAFLSGLLGAHLRWLHAGPTLPPPRIIGPDENGIKTVVKWAFDQEGNKVKITQRFRVETREVTVDMRVRERRAWPKFGACAGVVGPEVGITSLGDEQLLDLTPKAKARKDKEAKPKDELVAKAGAGHPQVKCRNCDGNHFTAVCPLASTSGGGGGSSGPTGGGSGATGPSAATGGLGGAGAAGKYVPPSARAGAGGDGMRDGGRSDRDMYHTLRISNLSVDATEADLHDLVSRFGGVQRIFLAKDRDTGESRGFAFVTFYEKRSADACKERLDGFAYDHLILAVDVARDSGGGGAGAGGAGGDRDRDRGGDRGGFGGRGGRGGGRGRDRDY